MIRKRPSIYPVIAVIVLLVAICSTVYYFRIFWDHRQLTHGKPVPISAETIVYSTEEPAEILPDCQSYRVADNEPRKLEIAKVGIDGCIQKVGIDQNNAVAVPTNVHLSGWYTKSALPGQKGVSLIDGHVMGRYGEAMFTNLGKITTGDTIRVQLGNGSWLEYEAVDAKSYSVDMATNHLFDPIDDVGSQLTLITCGGTYDKQAHAYKNRVIVRARLVV
jgi:LPXTG-site transpeptidase (sortase) family protein